MIFCLRDAVATVTRAAWANAGVQVLLMLLAGSFPVLTAWLLKALVDGLVGESGAIGRSLTLGLLAAGAGVATALLPVAARYLATELDRKVEEAALTRLACALSGLQGLARLENPAFYDRLKLATMAGPAGPGQTFSGLLATGQAIVTGVGFLATLIVLSPWLLLLVTVATMPSLRLNLRLSRRRAAMTWRLTPFERREMFYRDLLTRLDAAKEIRLFAMGDFLRGRMLADLRSTHSGQRSLDRQELRTRSVTSALSALATGVCLVWAVLAATAGRLTVGDVAIITSASVGFTYALSACVDHLSQLHHALTLYSHYLAVCQAESDLPQPATPLPVPPLRHALELRDVWFRYSPTHPWILRGVNLIIPAGQTVALVGLNGAGKSTLVKLLCRFYDPTAGVILWDKLDHREFDIDDLRRHLTAVFQDHVSYDLTARENIGVSDYAGMADSARVRTAAKRAGIDETLNAMPHRYETPLTHMFADEGSESGEGMVLSGGQWQRIAVARSLFRDAYDLMILDEPSTGLDALAEHAIHCSLQSRRTGKTTILISHRLSAVRDADIIAVLDKGAVVEQGSHHELIALDGVYARLFAVQANGYQHTG